MKQRIIGNDIGLGDLIKKIESRRSELAGLRGWRWLIHRIRIELWAMREVQRNTKGLDRRV